MNRALAAGVLTVTATAGYAAGTVVAYPGRSLTVSGLIVGVAVLAVGVGRRS
jgi:hypothetical protein